METKVKFHIPGWQWILATAVFFVAVLTCQQYILYDIEQSRVLVYEGARIAEQLMRAGGIADFIALFLQQFFLFNVAGAAIMAVLFVLVSMCLNKVYENAIGRSTSLAEKILCCLPAAILFVYTEGKIFFITGHVAILLSAVGLLIGSYLINWKNIASYILIPLLILFTGFAAQTAVWPMIMGLFLYSLLYKRKYIAAIVIVLSAFLMVGLARYSMLAVTNDELFSPDIYNYRMQSPTVMPWVWAFIVALTVIPFIFSKFISEKITKHIAFAAVIAVAVVGITHSFYKSEHSDETYERIALQRWIDTGEYDKAQEFCIKYISNVYTSNIYFMVLSQQGVELENEVGGLLKEGRQLIMKGSSIRFVRRHLMTLYYYLGYTNGAQREAFEYNEPTEGMMVPAAVKILAQTNIIQGNYALADKYLSYLDHTLFYSDWAQQYRKFLYNDKAVESDPELGPRRKALNIESVPQIWTTLPHVMRQISSVAPELPAANYKKAFLRLGEYSNPTNYDNQQQSYIQY